MKKLFALLSVLLFAACAHMPKSPETLNSYAKSVVLVMVSSPAGRWSGTGFSIEAHKSGDDAGSYILTNKHVCAMADNASYTLTDHKGRRYSAQWQRNAWQADLCLLRTDAVIEPVELAKKDPRKNEHLTVLGYPRGEGIYATDGRVAGRCPVDIVDDGFEIHIVAICTSLIISPGNSGSPAFDDQGRVRGIMFCGRHDSPHMTGMIGVEEIWKFLDTSENVYYR